MCVLFDANPAAVDPHLEMTVGECDVSGADLLGGGHAAPAEAGRVGAVDRSPAGAAAVAVRKPHGLADLVVGGVYGREGVDVHEGGAFPEERRCRWAAAGPSYLVSVARLARELSVEELTVLGIGQVRRRGGAHSVRR
jgi:hypothetical protein